MAVWKEDPERWSILECVEHLALAEEFLLSRLMAARAVPGVPPNRARERMILKRGADRTVRIEAPAVAKPCARYTRLEDAFESLSAVRARTIDWLKAVDGSLRDRFTDHPVIPGPVTCYEMLLLISAHPRRHAEQVRGIRSAYESAQAKSNATTSG
jgi:hypothetical protein